jgi:hypothetical protein
MIVSYANRPARWINIWSPFDWICGSLEYYDVESSSAGAEPAVARDARTVENVRDRSAPLDTVRAHLGYWKRPAFGERLHAAIVDAVVESNTAAIPTHASCAPSPPPEDAQCYVER